MYEFKYDVGVKTSNFNIISYILGSVNGFLRIIIIYP